ncbi:MAG: hypothetical protein AWU59_2212 [Methanolobus sp. T82-4]|nr:MAG: hypothetical protein AWU59_2212 [Methanolobus sp. T82-4]
MKHKLLYRASTLVLGLSLGVIGVHGLLTQGFSISLALFTLAGVGYLLHAGYFTLHSDASEVKTESLWVIVIAAVLGLSGVILLLLEL